MLHRLSDLIKCSVGKKYVLMGRSWCERGAGADGGAARHAAAASSPNDAAAGALRASWLPSHLTHVPLSTRSHDHTPQALASRARSECRRNTAAASSVQPTVRETRIHFFDRAHGACAEIAPSRLAAADGPPAVLRACLTEQVRSQ
ncbi:jg19607 [Pararge aegeria aegeria]|uniref:Jg19607 protein n=1 Tax=Pararge aegeria aegeria TaxID=348720 RepID=A0A8S4S6I0_9NEOP|nr:jg19607 [Pararge aegeria aegeria]